MPHLKPWRARDPALRDRSSATSQQVTWAEDRWKRGGGTDVDSRREGMHVERRGRELMVELSSSVASWQDARKRSRPGCLQWGRWRLDLWPTGEEGPVAAEEWPVTVGLLLGVAFPPRRVSIWHRWEWAWQRPLEWWHWTWFVGLGFVGLLIVRVH